MGAIAAIALGLLAVLLAAGGYDLAAALTALWRGSVGSSYAFFSATMVRAVPLLLAGLAVALAFRAGVWNIGAEGQLLAGATAAIGMAALPLPGFARIALAMLAACAAGAAWAAPAALLRRRGVLEVISTIMLNFVALNLVGYLVRGPLQEPTHAYPQSVTIPEAARLPRVPGTRLHLGVAIAVAAAVLLWMVMRRSAWGFRVRATGANPGAAASAGLIDVERTALGAFLVSGALAGLAGGIEATGVTYALYEGISPGYGYTAIAVALLARLDPLLVVPSAMLFGGLEAGATAMQRDAAVPAAFVTVVEGSLVLLVLLLPAVSERLARPRARREAAAS
ncbi:MAG: ABC transporter permease [Gemmatimonadaceae bacterium]|nr:ABC transporter permease [Gemmatimonadaceae bacterium]NUR18201.1 ABC transporter permease [Gemmatimonadaceae bacterium]